MTGTRNPSRKYFKRNQPYFYKSADNWEEWDTDESYDRTFFIGIDDSNPVDIDVALYMIWGGKAVAVVGSKVLDTVSGVVNTARQLEAEIQSILEEVQGLAAAVAQSQVDIEEAVTKMNALVDRCEGILDGAEAARDLAKDWANKMTGMVEEGGQPVDYSAKYYANEAKNSETAAAGSASNASASATTATEQATAAATSAEQAATSASTAASYASTAHIDASGAANSAANADTSATNAAQSATNAANSATDSANSATASATSAQAAQDALNEVNGLIATPIGTIFMSIYVDESLDIARRLNGQLISSTKFTGFRAWLNDVRTAFPNLFTTETNWQAEKTNSKLGQCGKFVIDDDAQTIRLPAVVNAQSLVDLALIGNLVNESLPNITGDSGALIPRSTSGAPTGAFKNIGDVVANMASGNNIGSLGLGFDASGSSSTYQDNAPVQQEAVQYPYYIQVSTGIDETLPAIREYNINTPFFFGKSMYSDVSPDNASWLVSNGQWNAKAVYPDYYNWLLERMNNGVEGVLNSVMYAYSPSGSGIIFTLTTTNPKVGMTCYGYTDGSYSNIPISTITSVNQDGTFVAAYKGTDYTFERNSAKDQSQSYPSDHDWVVNTSDETFRLPLLDGSEDLPSNRYEDLTLTSTTQRFTAPANGIYTVSGAGFGWIDIANETSIGFGSCSQPRTTDGFGRYTLKAKRGDQIVVFCEAVPSSYTCRFIYAKGNGTLYYYVGDTVQDASLINAGAVLEQLSNKADIDASNFNANGKSLLSGLGMPNCVNAQFISNSFASGTNFTAPSNGYFFFRAGWKSAGGMIVFLGTVSGSSMYVPFAGGAFHFGSVGAAQEVFLPVKKGNAVQAQYDSNANLTLDDLCGLWFIPAEGEN